ncbi:MAG: ABC transporter ATP-binding protein [bacterium]|nr:ABC transporter ATP-binding protein [bacterium]
MNNNILIKVEDLKTYFYTEDGVVPAVDGVSFSIEAGKTLGLVGESGCGKSVTSLSIMRLIPPPGKIVGGKILFDGTNLLDLPESEMRRIRGNKISMIFQEPMTSLNPVFTVGSQIAEAIQLHQGLDKNSAMERAIDLMRLVGIPSPELRVKDYPHQLSGGMRQRVMIAMALACNPKLLIADEPTTALDVTIQAQILELIRELREKLGMSVLLITHNLGVVAETADNVAVMYAGRIVEYGTVRDIFKNPLHPYTWGLLQAIPRLDTTRERLLTIEGTVPDMLSLPSGCKFAPRCMFVKPRCEESEPSLEEISSGHFSRCWRSKEIDFSKIGVV